MLLTTIEPQPPLDVTVVLGENFDVIIGLGLTIMLSSSWITGLILSLGWMLKLLFTLCVIISLDDNNDIEFYHLAR